MNDTYYLRVLMKEKHQAMQRAAVLARLRKAGSPNRPSPARGFWDFIGDRLIGLGQYIKSRYGRPACAASGPVLACPSFSGPGLHDPSKACTKEVNSLFEETR